jgi:hypothetical protein
MGRARGDSILINAAVLVTPSFYTVEKSASRSFPQCRCLKNDPKFGHCFRRLVWCLWCLFRAKIGPKWRRILKPLK